MGNLDDIRSILLQRENDRIAALESRLDVHRKRAAELAEVLPQALSDAHEAGTLSAALSAPMTDAVTRTVREQPQRFAEALFPIMGPAIRRSIAEALKSFTQQINDAVEHSLTPRGIRWRIEAKRAGVSFSEYVLRQTRTFDVEQLFVMETSTGRLLGHRSDSIASLKDKDAVSAMFSALQSFVRESFVGDNSDGLEIAEISGKTVWAVHGTRFSLAAVMAGLPPRALRRHLRDALDAIESLSDPSGGDIEGFVPDSAAVELQLTQSLHSMPVEAEARSRGGWFSPASVLFILLVLAAAWWGYRMWQQHHNTAAVNQALSGMPGIVINDIQFRGSRGVVSVLADPLAGDAQVALSENGLDTDLVTVSTTPYISLHPQLVAARLRDALAAPDSVSVSVAGDYIDVVGKADAAWIERARLQVSVLPGSNSIRFNVDDVTPVAAAPVVSPGMAAIKSQIEQWRIEFDFGVNIAADSLTKVQSLAAQLGALQALSEAAGVNYSLIFFGATDATGSDSVNSPLRLARATALRERVLGLMGEAPHVYRADTQADVVTRERVASVQITWQLQGQTR